MRTALGYITLTDAGDDEDRMDRAITEWAARRRLAVREVFVARPEMGRWRAMFALIRQLIRSAPRTGVIVLRDEDLSAWRWGRGIVRGLLTASSRGGHVMVARP